MGTIRAPKPEEVLPIVGKSISSMEMEALNAKFLNRDGEVVADLQIKNPDVTPSPSLRRVGSFDTHYRDVLVKDWYVPGAVPERVSPSASMVAEADRISWTLDGRFVAVTHRFLQDSTEFMDVFERDGDTFTKLTFDKPQDQAQGASWSPDGRLLVVGSSLYQSPNAISFEVYERSGSSLTKLPSTSFSPQPSGNYTMPSPEFSADGRYLASAMQRASDDTRDDGPFFYLYDRGADPESNTFTKLDPLALADEPTDDTFVTTWSPDTRYLYFGGMTGFYCYKRSGSLLTRISPGAFNPGSVEHAAWSPVTGTFLAVGTGSYVYMYRRSGDSVSKTAGPQVFSYAKCVAWTPDERYFVTSGYDAILDISFIEFRSVDPSSDEFPQAYVLEVPGNVSWMSFSPDGKHLALGTLDSPHILFYKSPMGLPSGPVVRFDEGLPSPEGV